MRVSRAAPGPPQACRCAAVGVGRLEMDAHDAAPGRDPVVEHDAASPRAGRATRRGAPSSSASSTAPSRARRAPSRRASPARPRRPVGERAPARDDPGEPLELLAADRGLDVGHPVVEAVDRIVLEDHLWSCRGARCPAPTCRAGAAGGSARRTPGSAVVSMPPSPMVITLRGWKEKQTMSPSGSPILLPRPVEPDLGADGAGGVLDHRQAVRARDRQDRGQIAGHARSGGRTRIARVCGGDRRGDPGRVDVVAVGLDVDEDRHRAALADRVGRGDEGVADRDHLVARADADGQQREMQRRGAVGHGAGVRRADHGGELRLEGRDLRALRQPAGEDRRAAASASSRPTKGLAIGIMTPLLQRRVAPHRPPPVDEIADALVERHRRGEAEPPPAAAPRRRGGAAPG